MAVFSPTLANAADSYYFFGDSLTAEGAGGQTAPVMWPAVLQMNTSVFQGADFAVGGATTSGYLGQVNLFLNSGDSITPNSVAAIWIGTNNVQIGANQNQPVQPLVQNTIGNIRTGIQEMVNAGVSNFIILGVYDLSLANSLGPANASSWAVRSVAAAASQQFNAQLAALAVPGAHIQYFDIAAFINQMQMHPQLYGFLQILPLQPGTTCNAMCEQTSIFTDQIHLTSKTQTLIGNYIASGDPIYNGTFNNYGAIFDNLANSSASIQVSAPLARSAAVGFASIIFDRLDATRESAAATQNARSQSFPLSLDPASHWSADPTSHWSAFIAGDVTGGRLLDASVTPNEVDLYVTAASQTAGFQYSVPDAKAGFAFNYTYLTSKLGSTVDSTTDLNSYQAALYASLGNSTRFIDGSLIGTIDDANQTRSGSFGQFQSNQLGNSFVASIRGGFLTPVGPIRIGPLVGFSFGRTWFDAYQEGGGTMFSMGVFNQISDSLVGSGGIQIRAAGPSAEFFDPFFNITYEHQFPTSSPSISSYLVNLPTQQFQTAVAIIDPDAFKVSFGCYLNLSGAWSGFLTADGSVGVQGSYAAGASVGLTYRF
jgi:lysophospholipase L1-like esterase